MPTMIGEGDMTAPFRIHRQEEGAKSGASKEGARGSSGAGDQDFRSYLDRLMKMIPAEVVGLYVVGSGFIPAGEVKVLAIWSAVCLIGVVAIRRYGTADPANGMPPQWGPVVISSIAFVIWVYSLGGPFEPLNLHVPYIGSLLVLGFTFTGELL